MKSISKEMRKNYLIMLACLIMIGFESIIAITTNSGSVRVICILGALVWSFCLFMRWRMAKTLKVRQGWYAAKHSSTSAQL